MEATDRDTMLKCLAAAEEAVARARDHVARQREIVASLESAGYDPALARAVLATLKAVHANHEQRLATLLAELTLCGWKLDGP